MLRSTVSDLRLQLDEGRQKSAVCYQIRHICQGIASVLSTGSRFLMERPSAIVLLFVPHAMSIYC